MREVTYILIAAAVGVQGYLFLRNPVTRSMRSVAIVVASGLLAIALGSSEVARALGSLLGSRDAGIAVSGVLGGCAALLPALVSNRWSRVVSSLPPADWDTHWAIWDLREAVRTKSNSESAYMASAEQARARLAAMQFPADVWLPVRDALLQQIDLTAQIVSGKAVDREEALALRAHSNAAWEAALKARRRFFR